MWYVVQTLKGQEYKVADKITEDVVRENEQVFILEAEKMYRIKGEWVVGKKPLFPGYLFAVTDKPTEFDRRLRHKCTGKKLLRIDDDITPIKYEEEQYLSLLGGNEHLVKYSEGYKQGDKVFITSGAFEGFEGEIKDLDRHGRRARLVLSLFGSPVEVEIGLGIVKSY